MKGLTKKGFLLLMRQLLEHLPESKDSRVSLVVLSNIRCILNVTIQYSLNNPNSVML